MSYIKKYFDNNTWLRKENANQMATYSQMKGFVSGEAIKSYTLSKYPEDIKKLHEEGYIHIHDLQNGIINYCSGIDFYQLLNMGLVTDRLVSKPAKHLDTALNQAVNMITTNQQENAGAQALGDFNTLLAPFIAKDSLTYGEVKQAIQRFIFDLNYPSRSGSETPFSNVMMNTKCPITYKEEEPWFMPGNTYEDFHDESLMILEAFNEILMEGDGNGNSFTFPLPTINVLKSTKFTEDMWYEIGKTEAKYGSYYFMNFDGSGISENSVRALCCRLILDLEDLPAAGGRWALQGSTGSLGICTINMAKLGYLTKDDAKFYEMLDNILAKTGESLLMKEVWIRELLDGGYLPMTKTYGVDYDRYFRTIGVVGLHEMCLNLIGEPIWNSGKFVSSVLSHIREWTKKMQVKTGKLWNLEMSPAEGAATRLAFKDREMHPGIITQGTADAPYYTSMITPPSAEMPFTKRLSFEEEMLPLFTGGTVFRIFMGENRSEPDSLIKFISKIAKKTKIPYYDISPTYSICRTCGTYHAGAVESCKSCSGEVYTYDRIVGYYRNRNRANVGKAEEIKARTSYNIFQ